MAEPRTPRNTTRAMRDDPTEQLLFLADGLATGSPARFIEEQEAAGQREMVASSVLPTKMSCSEDELTALGFTLGPVIADDPLFRAATLPDGWKREGSDHSMASYVVDELGRRRVSVFFKNAFYDRDAHMSLLSVAAYVSECQHEDTVPVLDEEWATRDAVLEAIRAASTSAAARADRWAQRGHAELEDEARADVAKWAAFRARLEQDGGESS